MVRQSVPGAANLQLPRCVLKFGAWQRAYLGCKGAAAWDLLLQQLHCWLQLQLGLAMWHGASQGQLLQLEGVQEGTCHAAAAHCMPTRTCRTSTPKVSKVAQEAVPTHQACTKLGVCSAFCVQPFCPILCSKCSSKAKASVVNQTLTQLNKLQLSLHAHHAAVLGDERTARQIQAPISGVAAHSVVVAPCMCSTLLFQVGSNAAA